MKIEGQAALVTGGASGLGEATARELARLGAKVAVLDVNITDAQKVASDIGGVACQCDITDTASVTAALAKAADGDGATAAPAPSRGRRAAPGAIPDDFPDDLPEDARVPSGSQ